MSPPGFGEIALRTWRPSLCGDCATHECSLCGRELGTDPTVAMEIRGRGHEDELLGIWHADCAETLAAALCSVLRPQPPMFMSKN